SGSDWKDTNVVEKELFANPKLTQWIKRADSLDTLAQEAHLPTTNLLETVRHWNHMIDAGEDADFHRFAPSSPERPPKLEKPPFFAVQFFPLSRKSLGGVAVDLNCRVLDKQKQPIPGLYAVGELTGVGGINGQAALEGTMLGPSILMGRIAAKDIAARLGRRPVRLPPHAAAESPSKPPLPDAETLAAWRETLRQLTGQSRPGYAHFEKAHAVVLARNYECARCHREASPLALTGEQVDRRALTQACPLCHGGVSE